MVPISAIGHDGENARMSGRCGFGAVMGSKKLKAVAAVGNMETEVADPARLMAQQRKMVPQLVEKMKGMHLLGTAGGTAAAEDGRSSGQNWRKETGPMPKRCRTGDGRHYTEEKLLLRVMSYRMQPRCGDIRRQMGGKAGPGTRRSDLWPDLSRSDLEAITYAADLCNRHGVDTMRQRRSRDGNGVLNTDCLRLRT